MTRIPKKSEAMLFVENQTRLGEIHPRVWDIIPEFDSETELNEYLRLNETLIRKLSVHEFAIDRAVRWDEPNDE